MSDGQPILHALASTGGATAVTMLVGWASTLYFARTAARLPIRPVVLAMLVLGASAYVGARLHYLLVTATDVTPWSLVTDLGAHGGGGVLALAIALPFVARAFRLPLPVLADVTAMSAGIALAAYRIGCQLRGCCIGTPTDLPWAIHYGRNSLAYLVHVDRHLIEPDAARSASVHPLPLYFAAAALLVTAGGRALYPHRRYDGQIALWSLVLFSVSTLGLESLRAPIPGQVNWGSLPQLTWIAIGLSIVSATLLAAVELTRRQNDDGRPAAHR